MDYTFIDLVQECRVQGIVSSGLAKQHQRLFVTSRIFMVKFLLKYFTSEGRFISKEVGDMG